MKIKWQTFGIGSVSRKTVKVQRRTYSEKKKKCKKRMATPAPLIYTYVYIATECNRHLAHQLILFIPALYTINTWNNSEWEFIVSAFFFWAKIKNYAEYRLNRWQNYYWNKRFFLSKASTCASNNAWLSDYSTLFCNISHKHLITFK